MRVIVDKRPTNCNTCIFRRSDPESEKTSIGYCGITKSLTHNDTIRCNVLVTIEELQNSTDDMK